MTNKKAENAGHATTKLLNTDLETKILEKAQNDYEKLVTDRHYLHSHPETGFDLTETMRAATYDAKVNKNIQVNGLELNSSIQEMAQPEVASTQTK